MRCRRSFTLVELMLVVIIIGVLASLVVPRLAGRAEKARRAAAKADVEANLPSAVDMFDMDVGSYPRQLDDLVRAPAGAEKWEGPYIKKLPEDPWGNAYVYKCCPGDHDNDYDLFSTGKDGVAGTGDDVNNWE